MQFIYNTKVERTSGVDKKTKRVEGKTLKIENNCSYKRRKNG